MIRTIFLKDLRDAIRDARVLVAILVPLGIGIFYSFVFDDDDLTTQTANVAYFAAEQTTLPDALRDAVGGAVRIDFDQEQSAESVEEVVQAEDADIGFVVPAGFDAAIAAGEQPGIEIFLPEDPTLGARYIAQAFEPAVRTMAGQEFPVAVAISTVEEPLEDQSVLDRLGLRTYMVLFSIVFLVGMIAMLVVPVILAEEAEKKTLDALVLVASYPDVIAGKALVGVAYIGIALAILLGITQIDIEMVPKFVAAALVSGVALIGVGLIMAGLFKSANQLNTWSGVFLIPVIVPAALVSAPVDGVVEAVLLALPTSQMMRLLTDATVGDSVFGGAWLSFLVIVVWGIVAYAVVAWQLSRRQA
jgi:ABC-2 type transport system permease protein